MVDKDNYLLELARYVVLNPVRARLCESPEAWPWSSYHATAGLTRASAFLRVGWLLRQFGRPPVARERYVAFVRENAVSAPFARARSPGVLGSDQFVWSVRMRVETQRSYR